MTIAEEHYKGTVLIVDDTPENLHLLSSMLKDHGYTVRAMISGPMALKSVQIDPPDIILLDINMPTMNGYEVCRRLKADEQTRFIPVIFISALGEVMNKVEAFKAGGIDYIPKPFQVEEVMARVNTHLSLRHMQVQLQEQNAQLQQEIHERSLAEDALRAANHRLVSLVEQLEQRNQEMQWLNQMSGFLQRSQSFEEAYTICLPLLRDLFHNQNGALYLITPETGRLTLVASWGEHPPTTQEFDPDACLALEGSRIHLMEDDTNSLLCSHVGGETRFPALCVQLITRGESLGLLHLTNGPDTTEAESGQVLDRWERLAVMVADRIAVAMANIQLRDQLREQSIRDPLTNLFNRRYLREILEREVSRARREHYSIGFVMFDIDHFKQYNDTFGHEAGDVLLQALSSFVLEHIRGEDVVCRYGGEEFLLIMPETTVEDTWQRAEDLRTGIEQLQSVRADATVDITVSFGVAVLPQHGVTAENVIAAADAALYRAKTAGRNCVVSA
jgi:diguanylate cyclase (GGDEF)-like protein